MFQTGHRNDIQKRFQSLRRSDEQHVPPFGRMIQSAREGQGDGARRRWRFGPVAYAALCLLVVAIAVAVQVALPGSEAPTSAAEGDARATHAAGSATEAQRASRNTNDRLRAVSSGEDLENRKAADPNAPAPPSQTPKPCEEC